MAEGVPRLHAWLHTWYTSFLTSCPRNRYCHFCQHVKVRASSMLACENPECSRRFCEHCLLTHLGEDVDPMSSDAWTTVNGKVRPRPLGHRILAVIIEP